MYTILPPQTASRNSRHITPHRRNSALQVSLLQTTLRVSILGFVHAALSAQAVSRSSIRGPNTPRKFCLTDSPTPELSTLWVFYPGPSASLPTDMPCRILSEARIHHSLPPEFCLTNFPPPELSTLWPRSSASPSTELP